jgi:DNA-binding CsgD family transcriptional regulator
MIELTPEEIAEARRLYALHHTPSRIAEKLRGFTARPETREAVRAVLDLRPNGNATPDDVRAKARELRATGLTYKEIGKALDVHPRTVKSVCSRVQVPPGPKAKNGRRYRETEKYKRAQELRRAKRAAATPTPVPDPILIEVPAWVPDHLAEFYEHTALKRDEHEAARFVRVLKAGGSVAHL